jgi:hypothetical protein
MGGAEAKFSSAPLLSESGLLIASAPRPDRLSVLHSARPRRIPPLVLIARRNDIEITMVGPALH